MEKVETVALGDTSFVYKQDTKTIYEAFDTTPEALSGLLRYIKNDRPGEETVTDALVAAVKEGKASLKEILCYAVRGLHISI